MSALFRWRHCTWQGTHLTVITRSTRCNTCLMQCLACDVSGTEMALSFACDGASPTLRAKKEYRQQRRQQERPPPVPAYPVTAPTPAWPRQAPAQAFDFEEDEEDEEGEEGQVLSFNSELSI